MTLAVVAARTAGRLHRRARCFSGTRSKRTGVSPVLASELSEKSVMSTDGQHVGELHTLTLDPATGELETLVVNTEQSAIFGIDQREDGRIHLPASVLESVSEQLIISPRLWANRRRRAAAPVDVTPEKRRGRDLNP
ncbi:PRC-barrel domain-containing protein [Halolamina pelagica]|uniref:PRC-barrel domain-containing protein n=1 Tax=Halolamina pelagica TaxID=699431 RepID=UPI002AA29D03|nr:PRC-barrel domain-containing protein [Halolamina pelagica]